MEDAGENPQVETPANSNKLKDAVKKLYNEFHHGIHNEYIWPIASILLTLKPIHLWVTGNRAQIEKGNKVLELGGGYPLYKVYSDKVGEDGVFVSLDINPNIQKRSKKLGYWMDRILKRQNHDEVVAADAGKLPFADSSFDVVVTSNFTGGNREYIKESFRVLKPGGNLVTAFTEPFVYPLQSRRNAKACKEAGFEAVKLKSGLPVLLTQTLGYLISPGVSASLLSAAMAWNWDVVAKKPEFPQQDLNSTVSISGLS